MNCQVKIPGFDAPLLRTWSSFLVPIVGALGLLLLAGPISGAEAQTQHLPRNALRQVVHLCEIMMRATSLSAPCLEVGLPGDGVPGYAVIRDPLREPTHLIVSPLSDVDGLENVSPGGFDLGPLLKAAERTRHLVRGAATQPISENAIGLAVNAATIRSQDHLHVHVECIRSDVLSVLRRKAGSDAGWRRLQAPIAGAYPFVTSLDRRSSQETSLTDLLLRVPGYRPGLASLLVVPSSDMTRNIVAVVTREPGPVEEYFDKGCERGD